MSNINLNLSDEGELKLKTIKTLGQLNNDKVGNKALQIEYAIDIANKCINFLDDESFENVIGKKKRL
jgi:hypothetical protein